MYVISFYTMQWAEMERTLKKVIKSLKRLKKTVDVGLKDSEQKVPITCLFKYHSIKNFELPINNIRIYYKNKRHSFKSPSERLFSILGPMSGCCGTSSLKFLGALLLNKIL